MVRPVIAGQPNGLAGDETEGFGAGRPQLLGPARRSARREKLPAALRGDAAALAEEFSVEIWGERLEENKHGKHGKFPEIYEIL